MWAFKSLYKKQNYGGWKEETDKHEFRSANAGKWIGYFLAFIYVLMFIAIARTRRKSYTATKNADSYGHRLYFPIPYSDCFSAPNWLLRSSTPNWLMSFVLTGFCGLSSLCGLPVKINKERSSGHSSAASKMPEIISPPWPPIHKYTQRPHTHTHECSLSCHQIATQVYKTR